MRAFVYFLPIIHYLTILPNHRVASLTISGNDIGITSAFDRPAAPEARHYKILSATQHGEYQWLYVKEAQAISLIIYYQSADKQQLYLLSEPQTYPSLAECKKANATLDPQKEGFETWYAPAVFKTYSTYPAIATADSAAVTQVARDFVGKIMEHVGTFRVTNPERLQNILSGVLIARHLNPNAALADLSRRIDQLHLDVPDMPRYHPTPRRPTLSPDTTPKPQPRT